jgi:glycosyltransferase involved in cell wall biosynthesis
LYRYVRRYVEAGHELRLVVIGSGPVTPPRHAAFDFRGFVSETAKAQACGAALALCQPSHHESFSRVIMESWMAGRPVLVNENCPPTRGHVERSKGGLAFRSYEEFAAAVDWLKANPALATQMGRNGQRYVQQNYLWPLVVDRFERIVKSWHASEA